MNNDSENKNERVQLNVDIPKKLKKDFEGVVKTRGLKKKYVVEQLIDKWVKGEINLD